MLSAARGANCASLAALLLLVVSSRAQDAWPQQPTFSPHPASPYPDFSAHDAQPQFQLGPMTDSMIGCPPGADFCLDSATEVTEVPSATEGDLGWAFTSTWLAAGGADSFGIGDFDWHRSLYLFRSGSDYPVVLAPGFGFHLWSGPQQLDLPPRVYDLYLDLSWRFLDRGWWGVAGGITPGLYGDFGRFDRHTFQLTGWLLGDWTLNEHWTVVAGLAYVRQLQSTLLPVGGLIWRPVPDLRLDLVIPRMRLAWRAAASENHETWAYVSGMLGGGAWAVDDGTENVLVQYSDLRLSLGLERSGPFVFGVIELGLAFARDIALNDTTVLSPDGAFFLQAGIEF